MSLSEILNLILITIILSILLYRVRHFRVRIHRGVKIYVIRVLDSNRVIYVGQTKQPVERRFKQHIYQSMRGSHKNKSLERFLKNHPSCCTIQVVDETSVDRASALEKYYIDKYNNKFLSNENMKE